MCHSLDMSRFIDDVRRARSQGVLRERFRPADVQKVCPGWADATYRVFLPKHRLGNPGDYTAYFRRHADGRYSLIT